MDFVKRQHLFIPVLIASFLILQISGGCATKREVPAPVKTTALPIFESENKTDYIELSVLFLLDEDGSVDDLHLVNSSGDTLWDSAAIDSIRNWRFPPSPETEKQWVRRTVRVEIIPAQILNIGELAARNIDDAELLYSRLRAGASFERLIRDAQRGNSIAKSGRFRSDVETTEFPMHVSELLHRLEEGQHSRPVQINGEYVIYKRYGAFLPDQ